MTVEELAVLNNIPHGHKNAVTSNLLAKKVKMPERKVRRIIQALIEDYSFPIGSSVDERPGYFKIVTEDDFDIAIRHLKPRAVKIFKRLRALERLAAQFGQVNIEEVIP